MATTAIGTLRLDDGSEVKGFLAEPAAFDDVDAEWLERIVAAAFGRAP